MAKKNEFATTILVNLHDSNATVTTDRKYNGSLVMNADKSFTFTENTPRAQSTPREVLYEGTLFKIARTAKAGNAQITGKAFELPKGKKAWEDFTEHFIKEATASIQSMIKAQRKADKRKVAKEN